MTTLFIVFGVVRFSIRGSCQTIWTPPPHLPSIESFAIFWISVVYSDTLNRSDITRTYDLIVELDLKLLHVWPFNRIPRDFYEIFATSITCQQKMLTPQDTWFLEHLELSYVLHVEINDTSWFHDSWFWYRTLPYNIASSLSRVFCQM